MVKYKSTLILIPLVTLVLVGAWTASEIYEISELKAKIVHSRLAAQNSAQASNKAESSKEPRSHNPSKSELDLSSIAKSLHAIQQTGSLTEVEKLIKFEQRLKGMDSHELRASIKTLESLGLTKESRRDLEAMILAKWLQSKPQDALDHYAQKMDSLPQEWVAQLTAAFKEWAINDPQSASVWLDQQVASGNFQSKSLDGHHTIHNQFEAAVMESLLSSLSPNRARERLQSMPEAQRWGVLAGVSFADLTDEAKKDYATLGQATVPIDARNGLFADMAEKMVEANAFSKVSDLLNSVEANPAERAAMVKQAAVAELIQQSKNGPVSIEQVITIRNWTGQQTPDLLDAITGKSLAEASQNHGKMTTQAAGEMALQFQRQTGKDDVLVAFLDGYEARSNLAAVKTLIPNLRNPELLSAYTTRAANE